MLAELTMTNNASTVDENDALYHRIRDGEHELIPVMIERNIPLVKSRVGFFLATHRRFRHLHEDLTSEGYVVLTTVVNSFIDTPTDKPTGRLVFDLDKAFGDYADQELGSGTMSGRSVRRRRSEGKPLPSKLPYDPNSLPAHLWFEADGRVIRKLIVTNTGGSLDAGHEPDRLASFVNESDVTSGEAHQLIASNTENDGSGERELMDEIIACCGCDEDVMIVELRIKGYTDAEIAEQLQVSQWTVWTRRKALYELYQERQR